MPTNPPGVLGAWIVLAILLSVVLGAGLLLWGRLVHRGFLVLVAAGVGLLAGGPAGQALGLNPLVARLVGAVTLGVLGVVLARVVWAGLAGLGLAGLTAGLVATFYLQASLSLPAPSGPDAVAAAQDAAMQLLQSLWNHHSPVLVAATAGAGVGGLIVAFLLPRTAVIVMTSVLGTALLSAGAWLAMALWLPTLLTAPSVPPVVWNGIGLGLLAAGVLFQTVGELRARRAEGRQKEPAAEKSGKKGGKKEE